MKTTTTQNPLEARRELYPPIEPYATGRLQVSDVHELYYEQCGNPGGVPVVVLHGGPGGGSVPFYRQYHDPAVYRIILFDQRGAGKSTPHACLEDNTTWHLVEDIEKLRNHLGIEKWHVFGGSWGSTLSLAYAETHPDRVKSLVLRGIFTLRRKELLFFYQEGASFIYPDAFEQYLEPIPVEERGDMISAYYKRLTGDNEEEKLRCAKAWSVWEMATSKLFVDPAMIARATDDDQFALAFARIECHYFINGGWFEPDDQLIKNASVLKDIPVEIVQGRYDLVCPMYTAWDLHKALVQSNLVIVADAGHSQKEPGIVEAMIKATENVKNL